MWLNVCLWSYLVHYFDFQTHFLIKINNKLIKNLCKLKKFDIL